MYLSNEVLKLDYDQEAAIIQEVKKISADYVARFESMHLGSAELVDIFLKLQL